MHESSAYDLILEEGAIKGAKRFLLRAGKKKFGQPDDVVVQTLNGIQDPDRLDRLEDAILSASSWQELLATT